MRATCLLGMAGVLAVSACVPRPVPNVLEGVAPPVRQRLEALRGQTGDALLRPGDPARMACLVERLTFPGAVALAAMGDRVPAGGPDGAGEPEASPTPIGYAEALERLDDVGRIRFTESQGREALDILASGRWQADLAHVLASLLDLAHRAPAPATEDVSSLHRLPEQLGAGVLKDATGLLAYRKAATLTLLDEERRREVPEFGVSTLKVLASMQTAGEVARTGAALLANDSVRLAVIVYARSHGIEIHPDDLDRVRAVLEAEDPDLAPLIAPAAEALARRYAGAQGVALLERMAKKSGPAACRPLLSGLPGTRTGDVEPRTPGGATLPAGSRALGPLDGSPPHGTGARRWREPVRVEGPARRRAVECFTPTPRACLVCSAPGDRPATETETGLEYDRSCALSVFCSAGLEAPAAPAGGGKRRGLPSWLA